MTTRGPAPAPSPRLRRRVSSERPAATPMRASPRPSPGAQSMTRDGRRARGPSRATATLLALAVSAWAPLASAKVLVLAFRGPNASKVQAAVVAALEAGGRDADAGDTSFEDAAMLIGCNPQSDACAAEVASTMAADELVFGTTSKSGEIALVRAGGGAPRRTAKVRPEPGASLEAAVAPAVRDLYDRAPADEPGDEPASAGTTSTASAETAPEATAAALPLDVAARTSSGGSTSRRAWIAWGAAGASTTAGLLLWLRASSLQDDIDAAPDDTAAELAELDDLRSRADSAAMWGNMLMVAGVGLAGLGTYYWARDHRVAEKPRAALAPALFHHGGGVVLTIEGP